MLTECGWARSGPPRYARRQMSKIDANAVLALARAQQLSDCANQHFPLMPPSRFAMFGERLAA